MPENSLEIQSAGAPGPVLSVVVPILNEEDVIEPLHSRLLQVLGPPGFDFEIIFVNDGSKDRSAEMLDSICRSDPRFKAIHFSRNFGHQPAVTAGLHAARGQCAVVIDADLQDPPELILEMMKLWREGYSVVYAQKTERQGVSLFKRAAYKVFYRIVGKISDIELPVDSGDFSLLDRQVVDLLNSLPERNRYVRGLRAWLGFKQVALKFDRPPRYAGVTKYPFRKMVAMAFDGIISVSKAPLRLAIYFGFLASAGSFILAIIFATQEIKGTSHAARGWASTIVVILFLGGIQLICTGVIGEFIGRIYDEVKQRPLYVIARSTGL
ncbi:MAG: glycosyltransferase family 2 protein [Gemmatimonadaceae bacterium]